MKINNEFVMREIAGDYVVVPVGSTVADFNKLITLNDTGAFLWERLNEEVGVNELTDMLVKEYEVNRETAETDVKDFIKLLTDYGVIEEND